MLDLSIIIVNWNTGDLLENCIKSIVENTKKIKYEIVVVDNASEDDSVKRDLEEKYNVNVIYSNENLGFAKGNNLAFEKAKGNFILLLNPDTYIKNNAIDNSYRFISERNDDIILGAKLLNSDCTIQLSSCRFPTLINMILKTYVNSEDKHKITHETDWVMGAFMMLKSELYSRVGKLDENFFMYSEDLDLCYQIKKNDGKVIHFADAEVIHFYNQSGAKKWNNKREKVITESLIKYINKNYKGLNRFLCKLVVNVRYLIKGILGKLK